MEADLQQNIDESRRICTSSKRKTSLTNVLVNGEYMYKMYNLCGIMPGLATSRGN